MITQICKLGCCIIKFCPLVIAFGRTIHSFQGQEAGPEKSIKAIIVNPGPKHFETSNPGTLNCCLTRASTLGEDNIYESAFFFTGLHINFERFHNMTIGRNGNTYEKVKMREKWIEHLVQQRLKTESIIEPLQNLYFSTVEKEIERKIDAQMIDNIIQFHIKNMKSGIPFPGESGVR